MKSPHRFIRMLSAVVILMAGAAINNPAMAMFDVVPCDQANVDAAWANADAICTAANGGTPVDCVEVTGCTMDNNQYNADYTCSNGNGCTEWICYYENGSWHGEC